MRLGEIRNILEKVTDDNNRIVISSEQLFSGQAYIVNNYSRLIQALDILSEQSWNNTDYSQIEEIKSENGEKEESVQLTAEEFNQLSSYVAAINQQVPYYFAILQSMVEPQHEQIINLKLSQKIDSLEGLSRLNKRLEKLFKEFTIDGEFKFIGFDKGSDWYVVLITGILTYPHFIACLKIAQEYLKTKKEYYESEKAKLDYEASLAKQDDFTEEGLSNYKQRRLDLEIERKVSEIQEKINATNGQTPEQLHTQLVIATKELVKELGEGTEFHLSLNPPAAVNEIQGSLLIDYKKIQQQLVLERKEQPQLEDQKGVDEKEENED